MVTSTLCSQVLVHDGLCLYCRGGKRGGRMCLPLIILVSTAREKPWYNHSILVLEHDRAQPGQEIWAVI